MPWIRINNKLTWFPDLWNIPEDLTPIPPDPEDPEAEHHTPAQLMWRKQIIRKLIRMRLDEKARKDPASWFMRTREKEAKRRAEDWQNKLREGPPKRPPGITVPHDTKWTEYAASFHVTKSDKTKE